MCCVWPHVTEVKSHSLVRHIFQELWFWALTAFCQCSEVFQWCQLRECHNFQASKHNHVRCGPALSQGERYTLVLQSSDQKIISGHGLETVLEQILFCMSANSESERDYGKGQGLNCWQRVGRNSLSLVSVGFGTMLSTQGQNELLHLDDTQIPSGSPQCVVFLFIIESPALC